MEKVTVLTALNFKKVPEETVKGFGETGEYWHLHFANGDHLSVCLTDGSEGGNFGRPGWERDEMRIGSVRLLLIQHSIISSNVSGGANVVCPPTQILFALGFKPVKGTNHDTWQLLLPNGDHVAVRLSTLLFDTFIGGPSWEQSANRVRAIKEVLIEHKIVSATEANSLRDIMLRSASCGSKEENIVANHEKISMPKDSILSVAEPEQKKKPQRDSKGRFIKNGDK